MWYLKALAWSRLALIWLRKYWYIPVIFILGIVLFIVTGGKRSPIGETLKAINKIKDKEDKSVQAIEKEKDEKENSVDDKLVKDKEDVKAEADEKIKDLKDTIEKDHSELGNNSEAINKELNDLLGG